MPSAPAAPTPSAAETLPRISIATSRWRSGVTPLVFAGVMVVVVMIIGIAFALGRSHEPEVAPSSPLRPPTSASSRAR